MTLLNKVFTTGTLVKIILVLTAAVAMKALSLHYDFSWATALAAEFSFLATLSSKCQATCCSARSARGFGSPGS